MSPRTQIAVWVPLLVLVVAGQFASWSTNRQNAAAIQELSDQLAATDQSANQDKSSSPPKPAGFVHVGGQVPRPGTYSLPPQYRLPITKLLLSTGYDGTSGQEEVTIIRRTGSGEEKRINVSLAGVFSGQEVDTLMLAGDTVLVHEAGTSDNEKGT